MADLCEAAAIKHRDAGRHRHRFDLIVRHVDEGCAQSLVQLGEFVTHVDAQLRIEIGKGLVHEEEAGWRTIARASATR